MYTCEITHHPHTHTHTHTDLITGARPAQRGKSQQNDGHPAQEVGHDDQRHPPRHGRVVLGLVAPHRAARLLGDEEHPQVGEEDHQERREVEHLQTKNWPYR